MENAVIKAKNVLAMLLMKQMQHLLGNAGVDLHV
jgi:hypothetical protein